DPDAFARSPSISIDYAVMERTARAAVVPSNFTWSDVGAWSALWALAERDGDGNVLIGDTLAEDTRGSYLRSEGPLIATVGVEDESIYIPLGSTHRLSNPGKVPLNLIEVQSGAYLGEDDIVRFEDVYARA